jgi:hypothetical protein
LYVFDCAGDVGATNAIKKELYLLAFEINSLISLFPILKE